MKTQTFIIALLMAALSVTIARAEEQQSPQEPSNTRFAEAFLTVFSDSKEIPLTQEALSSILMNDVRFSAAQEILEKEGVCIDYGAFPFLSVSVPKSAIREIGGRTIHSVRLTVRLLQEDCPPLAKEYLLACSEEFKTKLQQRFNSEKAVFVQKFAYYSQEVEQAEAELAALQNRQNELSGGMSLDKDSVLQRQLEHRRAMMEIALQRAILQRRIPEITDRMAKIRQEIDNKITNDEILSRLEGLLQQQQAELEKIEQAHQAGRVSDSEVREFREKFVRTQVELAQRKDQFRNEAGEQEIRALNRQLHEMTAQLDELGTKERVLMGTDPGSLSKSSDYEILQVKIDAAKENLHTAIMEKNVYARQMGLILPPEVRVGQITSQETIPDDQKEGQK